MERVWDECVPRVVDMRERSSLPDPVCGVCGRAASLPAALLHTRPDSPERLCGPGAGGRLRVCGQSR